MESEINPEISQKSIAIVYALSDFGLYCPKALGEYLKTSDLEMKDEIMHGICGKIISRTASENLADPEFEEDVGGLANSVLTNLIGFSETMGPGICTTCDSIVPTKKDDSFKKKLDYVFPRDNTRDSVLRNSLYYIHRVCQDNKELYVDNETTFRLDPNNKDAHKTVCTVFRDVTKSISLEGMYKIMRDLYDNPKDKNGTYAKTRKRAEKIDVLYELSDALTLLNGMIDIGHTWEQKLKETKRNLKHADKISESDSESQGEIIGKEYKHHMRLFPNTMPQEERDTETLNFIKKSAEKHDSFSEKCIDALVELTGVDPTLIYHYIRDTRGSTTPKEDEYFKERYSVE